MTHPLAAVPLLLTSLAVAACGSGILWRFGFGSGARFDVARVSQRGPYLDADLAGPVAMRTFTPASEVCAAVLVPERSVVWSERGLGGRFASDGLECRAAGIGEPLLERARQPRPRNLRVPREQANYSSIYEDSDVALLRGRFPLAHLVSWPGGSDTVVAVPNVPVCRRPIDAGVASMEYRDSGRPTLALVGERGLCPIVGLLRPPGQDLAER